MMYQERKNLEQLCVNTIRMLAVDMIEKANSGHPGLPLGVAPSAFVLWTKIMRHNPANPNWFNRDRFILSAGHGSALLYALLHLTGYNLPLDELKKFRQLGSKTPGHPEYGTTPAVEVTTGPLGQGFAMGVGMALAERAMANCINPPDLPVVDHYTYAIVSDGDLMEGVASEAASLAGTMKLGKLIYIYDNNHISIEGETDIAFTEDVARRFRAYGWQVLQVPDGNDIDSIEIFINAARHEQEKPSLVMVRSHIGYGSPKQDTADVHGSPLGPEAVKVTKDFFNWPHKPTFYVPEEALAHFKKVQARGKQREEEWQDMVADFHKKYPSQAKQFELEINAELPKKWDVGIPVFKPDDGPIATRSASGKVMNALAAKIPNFLGGSADLAPSTQTLLIGYGDLGYAKACSRNIHFGVREHAMGAMVNGMALHGGLIPYTGTFLIFSDYMRPTLRLAALMNAPSKFVFSHDSIGLGEDGPTHQPIEQLASLRAIPNFTVIRPADANETAAAWRIAVTRRNPVALILSRQKLPVLDTKKYSVKDGVTTGAYILADSKGDPDIILIATGSEVHLALDAMEELKKEKVNVRVVSMPSWELFEEQPEKYREQVLPSDVKARLAIEAGATLGWHKWVGDAGAVVGIDRFGGSAPASKLLEHYGFSKKNIVSQALSLINKNNS